MRAAAIHGGRSQNQRDKALALFKTGRYEALVATDVAARGIHVDGVACVLHYDVPEDGKAYLHRSGRTARAGAAGLVVSFVGQGDTKTVSRMQRDLEIPAPMTPSDIEFVKEMQASAPKVRVAPNKPLVAVVSDEQQQPGRSQRSSRPRRRNGERSGGQGREAQARSGRPNRGRPPSRRAS